MINGRLSNKRVIPTERMNFGVAEQVVTVVADGV